MMTLRQTICVVAILNLAYFGIEFTVALSIGSVSLFGDSVDFLEDAIVRRLGADWHGLLTEACVAPAGRASGEGKTPDA